MPSSLFLASVQKRSLCQPRLRPVSCSGGVRQLPTVDNSGELWFRQAARSYAWTPECARASAACPLAVDPASVKLFPSFPFSVLGWQKRAALSLLHRACSHQRVRPSRMSDIYSSRGAHGQAIFTQAAKRLRVLILSLLEDIDKPSDAVALHSQLLVHLWARPFENFVVRSGTSVLTQTRRDQLHFVFGKLSERITNVLRQDPLPTPLQQLQAVAKIFVSLSLSAN